MSAPTTTLTAPRSTNAATDATATAQPAAPNSVPNPSFEDGLRALHEQYVEAVNHAVAEERDDLVEHLAAEYTDEATAKPIGQIGRSAPSDSTHPPRRTSIVRTLVRLQPPTIRVPNNRLVVIGTRVEAAAPLLMRVALGVVFIWFGALKVANVTPVAKLVADTLAWVPVSSAVLLPALGAFEIALGATIIVGWQLRLALAVLIAHLSGTFLVLVVLPQVAFERGNPLLLTTIGEFVVKNVVFIAAALLLTAWPRAARTAD